MHSNHNMTIYPGIYASMVIKCPSIMRSALKHVQKEIHGAQVQIRQ